MNARFACIAMGILFLGLSSPAIENNNDPFDFENVWCCKDLKNEKLQAWVDSRNKELRGYLDAKPITNEIAARIKELNPTNPPLYQSVLGRTYYLAKGSLWLKNIEANADIELVQGHPAEKNVVGDFRVSRDGEKVAFSMVANGGDTQYWSVVDTRTKKIISGPPIRVRLENVSWDLDSEGIFYSHWPQSDDLEYEQLKGHRRQVEVWYRPLHSNGDKDIVIFRPKERPQNLIYSVSEIEKGKVFLAHRSQGPAEILITASLIEKKGSQYIAHTLPDAFRYSGKYIGNRGPELFFRTTEAGDLFGVVSYNYKTKRNDWLSHNGKTTISWRLTLMVTNSHSII